MKQAFLLFAFLLTIPLFLFAQTPTLGTYSPASVAIGGNISVSPSVTPGSTTSITAITSTNFKGLLQIDPATGVLKIINAYPAGTYSIAIKAFSATSSSAATNCLFTVAPPVCSQGYYTKSQQGRIGYGAESVAVGDFNGDNKQDVATANFYNDSVTILLGDGAGNLVTTTNIRVGSAPRSIAVSDFNGDGKADFATANYYGNTISVRLGNGTGGFTGTTTLFTGNNPYSVIVGDFNNDGKQDLAVANSAFNSVSIFPGYGNGGFDTPVNTYVNSGSSPQALAAGDFNNDGKLDLAVANNYTGVVSICIGNGTGNFTRTDISAGNSYTDIKTADFNGDGKRDLVLMCGANSYNYALTLLGNGAGAFSFGATTYTNSGIGKLTVGDFNGDGKQDIAATATFTDSVFVRLGNGAGGFIGRNAMVVSSNLFGIATGNFDGDDKQDLVVAGSASYAFVLRGTIAEINLQGNGVNIPDGANAPGNADSTNFGNAGVTTRTFTVQNTGAGSLSVFNIRFSDVDSSMFKLINTTLPATIAPGASFPFRVQFTPTSAGLRSAIVTIYNDDCDEALYDFAIQGTGSLPTIGTYAAATVPFSNSNITVIPSVPPAFTNRIIAIAPVRFKGVLHVDSVTGIVRVTNAYPAGVYPIAIRAFSNIDTVTAGFMLTVGNPQCSQGLLDTVIKVATSSYPQAIAVGDFNNDGNQDYIVVSSASGNNVAVWLGNGNGSFTAGGPMNTLTSPRSVVVADFNGDGRLDFAAITKDSSISVRLGNGAGGFTTSSPDLSVGLYPGGLLSGDFNDDGKTDLVAINSNDSTISVRLGDGTGRFTSLPNFMVGGYQSFPGYGTTGDFNGDGKADIALSSYTKNSLYMLPGNGTGSFGTVTTIPVVAAGVITAADFNKDGKQDLAVCSFTFGNTSGKIPVYFGDGTGNFTNTPTADFTIGAYPRAIAAGDFNGDGNTDLAIARSGTNLLTIRLGTSTGNFPSFNAADYSTNIYPTNMVMAIGDYNNDGRQDIWVPNYNNSTVSLFRGVVNEISIKGNNTNIIAGSTAADSINYTYLGNINVDSSLTRTYTIENTGTGKLLIRGINISGANASLFTPTGIFPFTSIPAGASTTFTLTFSPTDGGAKDAKITISNDDCDEPFYEFVVKGKAVCANLSATNTWLGITADWNTSGNWSLGFVPNGCGVAVVNAGVPFMPQISTNASCYSLTLNNGATFTVTGTGHLTITGP